MTNEEAKKIIFNQWQAFLEDNIDYGGISEAYKMAIKALEQQPCDDCISREQALIAIQQLYPCIPRVDIMDSKIKWQENMNHT